MMGLMLAEYVCEAEGCTRGRFEDLMERPAPRIHVCPLCSGPADRVISAPKVGTVWAAPVSRAKSDAPPTPRHLDTRALADGMSMNEFRKQRSAMWRDHELKRAKDLMS